MNIKNINEMYRTEDGNYEKYRYAFGGVLTTVSKCVKAAIISCVVIIITVVSIVLILGKIIDAMDYLGTADTVSMVIIYIGCIVAVIVMMFVIVIMTRNTIHNIHVDESIDKELSNGTLIRTKDGKIIRPEEHTVSSIEMPGIFADNNQSKE